MASLLLWWSPSGAELDERIWKRMIERMLADAGIAACTPECSRSGSTFRAFAIRTLPGQPDPIRDQEHALFLSSLRHDLADSELSCRSLTEPAAVIRLDRLQNKLSMTRDLLGHRNLVWARTADGVLVSTNEEPILLHPAISRDLDDQHIASIFAYVSPDDDSTPFVAIRSVPPGATIEITERREQLLRHCFEPCADVAGHSDRALAGRFRELLEDSVHRAMTGAKRVGFSLSSGLDAASIAMLAARSQRRPARPFAVTYSYGAEAGADCDERIPAGELARTLGFEFSSFDASEVPLNFTLDSGWTNPLGMVLENPYRELRNELYRHLRIAGVDVLLAGHGADQYAMNPANWLWSAWKDRRWNWIASSIRSYWSERGIYGTLRHPAFRRLARYLLLGRASLLRFKPPDSMPAHLQSHWCEQRRAALERFRYWPDPVRAEAHFNWLESADYSFESRNSERYGLDIRCPFRDWKLTQFALSTPAYLMTGPIGYKWMQKQALQGLLDQAWLDRKKCGNLSPLWRASYGRRESEISTALRSSRSFLQRFTNHTNATGRPEYYEGARQVALLTWYRAVQDMRPTG